MHSQDEDPKTTMPIGEVARRTGVTVPTLRAWERRYELLLPVRTAGGHRRYSDEDVQRVLAVLELTGQGWGVGAAARRVAGRRSAAAPALPPADELRDRLWSALDQALRNYPGTEAAGPPGDRPPRARPRPLLGRWRFRDRPANRPGPPRSGSAAGPQQRPGTRTGSCCRRSTRRPADCCTSPAPVRPPRS